MLYCVHVFFPREAVDWFENKPATRLIALVEIFISNKKCGKKKAETIEN